MAKKQTESTLSLTKINKIAKQAKESIIHEFSDGETLKLHPIFSPQKIEKMLEEYGQLLNHFEKEHDLDDKFKVYFLYFQLIRTFTDLGKVINKDPSKMLNQFNNLIETHYFNEIIEDAFLKEEIQKVWDKATKVMSTYAFLEKVEGQFKDQVSKMELENREIFEKINLMKDNQEEQNIQ